MVEYPPELFLQLAEQAEICRTSCDLLKSCPDRKGKLNNTSFLLEDSIIV